MLVFEGFLNVIMNLERACKPLHCFLQSLPATKTKGNFTVSTSHFMRPDNIETRYRMKKLSDFIVMLEKIL